MPNKSSPSPEMAASTYAGWTEYDRRQAWEALPQDERDQVMRHQAAMNPDDPAARSLYARDYLVARHLLHDLFALDAPELPPAV